MSIIFFGNSIYSRIGAQIIHQTYPISLIVTIPDRLIGRKKLLSASPTKQFALENNIPVLETGHLDQEVIDQIAKYQPDFLVVEDYGLFLPNKLLNLTRYAPLNIHHSLLPKYRGPSPAPSAILNGDSVTGVTIIKMAQEIDGGDILAQQEYALDPQETTDSLLKTLNKMGANLLIQLLPKIINDKIKPLKQSAKQAINCLRIQKEDGYFDIDNPPPLEKLDRMIRAYYPWPTAWTKWKGKIVKLLPKETIQMEGKKPVSLKDFLHGYPNFPIKSLS